VCQEYDPIDYVQHFKITFNPNYTQGFSLYRAVNTLLSVIKSLFDGL